MQESDLIRQMVATFKSLPKEVEKMAWNNTWKKGRHFNSPVSQVNKTLVKCLIEGDTLALYKDQPAYFTLEHLSNKERVQLLLAEPNTFTSVIAIDELPTSSKVELFLKNQKYIKYIDFEALSSTNTAEIARRRPSAFKKYGLPLNRMTDEGWKDLIRKDKSYQLAFVERIPNMKNKTNVRSIFRKWPSMTKLLTTDMMCGSVVSAKEWALMLDWKELVKANASYIPEVNEWLREEITMEVLTSGKKSLSLDKVLEKIK